MCVVQLGNLIPCEATVEQKNQEHERNICSKKIQKNSFLLQRKIWFIKFNFLYHPHCEKKLFQTNVDFEQI